MKNQNGLLIQGSVKNSIQVNTSIIIEHYSDQMELFLRDEYLPMDPVPKSSKSSEEL